MPRTRWRRLSKLINHEFPTHWQKADVCWFFCRFQDVRWLFLWSLSPDKSFNLCPQLRLPLEAFKCASFCSSLMPTLSGLYLLPISLGIALLPRNRWAISLIVPQRFVRVHCTQFPLLFLLLRPRDTVLNPIPKKKQIPQSIREKDEPKRI